jgi:5-methylcytosine-specific restriction enzyme A
MSGWYGTQRWRRRARMQLRQHPLCCMCERAGKITPATVADHVEPHRGSAYLFWFGHLQSLCTAHHSGSKAEQERRGFTTDIGLDGWPTDPKHPVHRTRRAGGEWPKNTIVKAASAGVRNI